MSAHPDAAIIDLIATARAALDELERRVARSDPPRRLLKIGEVQSIYRVAESTARRWAEELGFQVAGGLWFVDQAVIEQRRRRP